MTSCKAVQHSDQMVCECGNVWDMNDPDPPHCNPPKKPEQQVECRCRRYGKDNPYWPCPVHAEQQVDRGALTEVAMQRFLAELSTCDNYYGETHEMRKDGKLIATVDVAVVKPGMKTPSERLEELLAKSEQQVEQECGCCGQTVECDDDCDSRLFGKRKGQEPGTSSALSVHREQGVEQNPTEREALEVRFSTDDRTKWTVKDWYSHFGAWENDKGQLCFGSTIAFAILLERFHSEIARQCALSAHREQQGGDV